MRRTIPIERGRFLAFFGSLAASLCFSSHKGAGSRLIETDFILAPEWPEVHRVTFSMPIVRPKMEEAER
jgi:hypothetical protein